MTNAQIAVLLAGATFHHHQFHTQVGLPVPFLSNLALPVKFERDGDQVAIAAALSRFAALPSKLRKIVEARLFEQAQRSFADCAADFATPQDQLDWEAEMSSRFSAPKVPTTPADIWALVAFTGIEVYRSVWGATKGRTIVRLCGECAWDGEHGLGLFFVGGDQLVAVGDFNG